MPFYSYQCEHCNATTTAARPVDLRDKPVRCACGKNARKRLMSTFSTKIAASTAPRSLNEKLAGKRVMAPVTAGPTSVLGHACHSGCSH